MMANIPTDGRESATGLYVRRPTGRLAELGALPLRGAWSQMRRMARQAVQRRMTTEMADLAVRIRKLQDHSDHLEGSRNRR